MDAFKLQYYKLNPRAKSPSRASNNLSALDLYSPIQGIIPPCGKLTVSIGLIVKVPIGCIGRIVPIFDLLKKYHINVEGDLLDSQFRSIILIIYNLSSDEYFHLRKGQKIGRLVLEMEVIPSLVKINDKDQLL